MIKEKKILLTFSFYLFVGLLICFIGLSNVFAATYYVDYSYSQKYFDNNGSSVTGVTTTWNQSLESYVSGNITTSANSYGAGLSITSPIPILENHTYTLSFSFVERNNIALSSKNYIGISSTLQGAANNYANSEFDNELITSSVSNNSILNFAFTSRRNGQYIFIPWTTLTNTSQTYVVTEIIMEDLGSEGVSINDINSSLTNQTNILNTSINNMGEDIKDSIKDEFNDCHYSVNLFNINTITEGKFYWSSNNTIVNNSSWVMSDYIKVEPNIQYTYSWKRLDNYNEVNYSYYDSNKNLLGGVGTFRNNSPFVFTTPSDSYYIRIGYRITDDYNITNIQLEKGSIATTFEPYGEEICKNKIDETNDKLDETNNQLGDLNNNITDDNIDNDNVSNAFSEFESFVDDNATISSLITLPVTLFTAILNGLQNSCSPFNLGSLYGENLILPCIDISSYLGNTLWTMIDIIISGFAIYFISQKFIKVFNNFSSMKEGDVIDD